MFFSTTVELPQLKSIRTLHQHTQSVGATGGVYKRQGRSRRAVVKRAY